ncbi:hypothetical protein K440DRAFT_231793 [Wilcoxina mikolae CBS 423.85]|nr:hypothetical protein K440DRAFT_231793 [Wilcoxina mikolae CBS 423.85]
MASKRFSAETPRQTGSAGEGDRSEVAEEEERRRLGQQPSAAAVLRLIGYSACEPFDERATSMRLGARFGPRGQSDLMTRPHVSRASCYPPQMGCLFPTAPEKLPHKLSPRFPWRHTSHRSRSLSHTRMPRLVEHRIAEPHDGQTMRELARQHKGRTRRINWPGRARNGHLLCLSVIAGGERFSGAHERDWWNPMDSSFASGSLPEPPTNKKTLA